MSEHSVEIDALYLRALAGVGLPHTHPCNTPVCPGDGRYAAPGRGHFAGCQHPGVYPPAVMEEGR